VVTARRLGASRLKCATDVNCPDFFELADGRVAVIGALADDDVRGMLPPDAGIGPEETLVVVPKAVWMAAVRDA
jgi:hypothetical protein